MRVIVATNNVGKIAELRQLLPSSIELLTLAEMGIEAPDETGSSFVDNALLKARNAAHHADGAIADDSGLAVDALDGEPGIRSARFSGIAATDESNNRELLRRLHGVDRSRRGARFVSAAAYVSRDGDERVVEGSVNGVILTSPRGDHGFGYDPLFEIDDRDAARYAGRTLAELTMDEKNEISHRARAVRTLIAVLRAEDLLSSSTDDEVQE